MYILIRNFLRNLEKNSRKYLFNKRDMYIRIIRIILKQYIQIYKYFFFIDDQI